jgi:hypothetical protein
MNSNVCSNDFKRKIVDSSGNFITTSVMTLGVTTTTYYGIDQRPYHISIYSCQPGYICNGKKATACVAG